MDREMQTENYYHSENYRQRYKIKETTLQSYRQMSNQNTKKSSVINW